jgi:hypothetical protein
MVCCVKLDSKTPQKTNPPRLFNQKTSQEMYEIDNNPNTSWLQYRGSWTLFPIAILLIHFFTSSLPIQPQYQWTLTNLTYHIITFIMFHWLDGTPFIDNNEFEGYTLWEQMDHEDQFTPTKKYLCLVSVVLFLFSTHVTQYDVWMFVINLTILIIVLVAKLPQMHKVRLFGFNNHFVD